MVKKCGAERRVYNEKILLGQEDLVGIGWGKQRAGSQGKVWDSPSIGDPRGEDLVGEKGCCLVSDLSCGVGYERRQG